MLLLSRWFGGVLLLAGLTQAHAGDTIVKDYDISLSQEECRQTSIRILHSLAGPDMPVMQLEPLVFYSDEQSELIAIKAFSSYLHGACWQSRGSLPFTRRLCGVIEQVARME
jgi:hypothetical protein